MPAGIKEAAALRLGFVCKDQTASLDLIDLIAEENSEMTVVMVMHPMQMQRDFAA